MRVRGLLVFLLATALATAAAAQTKISATEQCAKPDPMNTIDVGDRPGHALVIAKVQCTWSKPFEMAGSQVKDAVNVESSEMSGDKSSTNGYHNGTTADGDKYVVRYRGVARLKDGKLVAAEGTWSYISGTGKLKGIKGKGTYKGKSNADGTTIFDVEGEYQIP